MRKSVIMLGLVGLLLGGCSTVPKELAYEPADQLVAYQPALQGMESKPARWSGVISAVHNKADQSVIEVVYLPLKSNGVPEQTEQSPGRFLAIMQGFVDPTLYAKGRSLTVLGTLDKRARYAVEARFGLIDGERKSFREVGENLGVTAEAARRLVSRAVAGLREDAVRILAA